MLLISALRVLSADNADVSRQMEEAEGRASQLSRSKTLLQSQLEELKKQLDEEVKVSVLNSVWKYEIENIQRLNTKTLM